MFRLTFAGALAEGTALGRLACALDDGTCDGRLTAWIHVLSFTERDALATHFVAKAEIRTLESS